MLAQTSNHPVSSLVWTEALGSTHAWGCGIMFLLMLCSLSLGTVFVPQTTALKWLSLEWKKDRICHQELQSLQQWREHFILAVCRKISFFMSRSLFILSLSSWALRVQLSVLESVEAQLTASCALLLSPSQMLRDSLQGGSTDSQMRISRTFPWWEVPLGLF